MIEAFSVGHEPVPGYRVVAHLSRGRALDAYAVWSEERDCLCVVKALRPDRLDDRTARRRLRREGRLVERLAHPHIVRAYELIERPHPVLVLEALTGETLAYLIERSSRRLPAAELAALGLHLSSAIGYLHRQGYLHLDLKPSNVVSEAGQAKVIDFSIARPPGPANGAAGTRVYMAPEQDGGVLTEATDVWGIGAVLYEAAAGHRADGEPLRRKRRLAFAAAVDACLEPYPKARPSITELAGILDAYA
jgi:eukaryotic-like serine/threonine-protein kinase